jgi:hypothetical protein
MTEKRGGQGGAVLEAAQDADSFGLCLERLERAVLAVCDPQLPWPAGVAAGIRAALQFADAAPVAAGVLTVHATGRRLDGAAAFAAMVDRFADLLLLGAPPTRRPDSISRNVVARIARQMILHLENRPDRPMTEIAPDLINFALTPFLDFAEAKRWSV